MMKERYYNIIVHRPQVFPPELFNPREIGLECNINPTVGGYACRFLFILVESHRRSLCTTWDASIPDIYPVFLLALVSFVSHYESLERNEYTWFVRWVREFASMAGCSESNSGDALKRIACESKILSGLG